MNFRKKENSTNNSTTNKNTNHAIVALSVAIIAMLVGSAGVATVGAFAPTYTSATINAGGSSFVAPLQQTWAKAFASVTPVTISYTSSSSGTGLNNLYTTDVGFAASDAPVSSFNHPVPSADSSDGPLLQFPDSLGGVAIFYNIPGVTVSLKLTSAVIAGIYLGTITTWNNPAITALNPGVTLPSNAITPVYRSDGSGTSYALSNYLSKTQDNWNSTYATWQGSPCSATTPCFTTNLYNFLGPTLGANGVGESGSGGVAGYVEGHSYTIGYADSFYAFSNNLLAASIQNSAGNFEQPSQSSISAAAAADASHVLANPIFYITNAPGAGSYPISTFTYVMVWQDQDLVTGITGLSASAQQAQGNDVAQYLWWIVTQGQTGYPSSLDYVALPPALVQVDEGIIQHIQYQGTPYINATATTTVSCTASSIIFGSTTTCTATVGGQTPTPTGTVAWTRTGPGSVSFTQTTCTLSSGSCSVTVKGSKPGSATITATYSGDNYDQGSSGTTTATITQAHTTTTITCTKSSIAVGKTMTCTVTVTGPYSSHTGTITWSKTAGKGKVTFSPTTCKLTALGTAGKCSVTVKGTIAGSVTIEASYGGNTYNLKSSATLVRTIS
jgi:phosphate transport system substrate-binding protein